MPRTKQAPRIQNTKRKRTSTSQEREIKHLKSIEIPLTYQSPSLIPFNVWHLILSYFPSELLRTLLITCKAFNSILIMNDRALWYRAKPYIVDLDYLILNGISLDARGRWKYCTSEYECFCDTKLPQYVQPCLELIDTAIKQRWHQAEYSNIIQFSENWSDLSGMMCYYYSLWKSLDTESILYLFHISGEGFICLDTKDQALVVGIEGGHPEILSMDFIYGNSDGSGPPFDLYPIKPLDSDRIEDDFDQKRFIEDDVDEDDYDDEYQKQFTMEEAKRELGIIDVDRVFATFRKLTLEFLGDRHH